MSKADVTWASDIYFSELPQPSPLQNGKHTIYFRGLSESLKETMFWETTLGCTWPSNRQSLSHFPSVGVDCCYYTELEITTKGQQREFP